MRCQKLLSFKRMCGLLNTFAMQQVIINFKADIIALRLRFDRLFQILNAFSLRIHPSLLDRFAPPGEKAVFASYLAFYFS